MIYNSFFPFFFLKFKLDWARRFRVFNKELKVDTYKRIVHRYQVIYIITKNQNMFKASKQVQV